jgi:hypothetical protein
MKCASIKFPKNFQPVGVSNKFNPNLAATLSMAPEVGIDLATPVNGELRKHSEFEARIANESEGVTKKLLLHFLLFSQNHVTICVTVTSSTKIRSF